MRGHGSLVQWLAAVVCIAVITWLALEYLVPSPPSKITLPTGPKGSSFDYFGKRYRERFAHAGVRLELRQTVGALESGFCRIQNPMSILALS